MNKPAVVILDLYDTGLAAGRALARLGYTVHGFDSHPQQPGFHSRFIQAHLTTPPGILSDLLQLRETLEQNPLLIPASDSFVQWISDNDETLSKCFNYSIPNKEILQRLSSKFNQNQLAQELGWNPPFFWEFDSADDRPILNENNFPIILKGAKSWQWQAAFGTKAQWIRNSDELDTWLDKVKEKGISVLLQEWIPGPVTDQFEVSGLVTRKFPSQPISITIQKLRQYPEPLGFGTEIKTISKPELTALVHEGLKKIQYTGFFNIEFKWDPRTNTYRFIELNPRVWQQIDLAQTSGLCFPLLHALDATHEDFTIPEINPTTALRWIDPYFDLRSRLQEPRALTKITAPLTWLRSLFRAHKCGLYSWDDPLPALKQLGRFLFS